jgi:hypothetical protein
MLCFLKRKQNQLDTIFDLDKRFLQRILQFFKKMKSQQLGSAYTIIHDLSGLYLTLSGKIETEINWNDVKEVFVFKRDLYVVDQICMAFVTSGDLSIEINEEMGGWDELVHKLPEYLPGCKSFEAWFLDVMQPAFETNLTKLYQRN